MADYEQGGYDDSRIIQALTAQGGGPAPDTTAEDSAMATVFGPQQDIPDSFGSAHMETAPVVALEGSTDTWTKNGEPFQIRLVSGFQGGAWKIVKKQMYLPPVPLVLVGKSEGGSQAVEIKGSIGGRQISGSGWQDIGLAVQNVFIKITIDNTEADYCDPKTYRYAAPKISAEWQTSGTVTEVTEGKIVYSVPIARNMPQVVGGKVQSTKYDRCQADQVTVYDPFAWDKHVVPMDVVSDIRFEDTGTEIKCHVTRAKVGVVKLYEEDATPREDHKTDGEEFRQQSDAEVLRVLKLEEIDNDTEAKYSTGDHRFTKTVTKIRVVKRAASSGDPKDMQDLEPQKDQTVFQATSHADEHRS